jgi:lipid-A-disaccharide synthase
LRYYIISGEASGDLHGSRLIRELKNIDAEAQFRAWGGDMMQKEGADLVKHYRDLAFMGFKEVIVHLPEILRNISLCKADIMAWQPDAVIFIDYPGFNMRLAGWAHQHGFKTIYYISPQIWAWKQSRAWKLKKNIDLMVVILPFEQDFYRRYDFGVEYVGHPLLDAVEEFVPNTDFIRKNGLEGKPIIALLPGSRMQEISRKLPVMLSVAGEFREYTFVIAGAPGLKPESYSPWLTENTTIIFGQTYDLLSHARAALVTSGTATLETALLGCPEVVCYKGSKLSYAIGKRLVKVAFISLVNLIMGREVVKELIQDEMTPKNLEAELNKLLHDEEYRQQMKSDYADLRQRLGGKGASARAAEKVREFLKRNSA